MKKRGIYKKAICLGLVAGLGTDSLPYVAGISVGEAPILLKISHLRLGCVGD